MRIYYRIVDIVHSGRKGIRGERVTDVKYDGLIGSRVGFDIKAIKHFESVRMYLLDYNPYSYRWWDTSEVIALNAYDGKIELETANTIYKFEEINEKEVGD